jgi:hypothetical protein
MIATAACFSIVGGGLLFFPDLAASSMGLGTSGELGLQLFAGGLFAIAALDWIGRGAIYGGIYGRPIVVANFGFGLIAAATLLSAMLDGGLPTAVWLLVLLFAAQAVGFWRVMRGPPWAPVEPDDDPKGPTDG